jgi:hypothetical protein
MTIRLSTLSAAMFLLAAGMAFAQEQPAAGNMMHDQDMGMMGQGSMMGTMPQGMMGSGMMHRGPMLKVMVILMDANGDGAVSLEEFEAVHARIFKAVDDDKDGKIAAQEIDKFLNDDAAPSGH